MKNNNNNITTTVLRHFNFQVLLVRMNILFKGLIATFSVLLHCCITLLGS